MARHKYSLLVALGLIDAKQAADAAMNKLLDRIGKIHAPAAAECAGKLSLAHYHCIVEKMVENAANLIRSELGPVAAEIRARLQPLVQAKLKAVGM